MERIRKIDSSILILGVIFAILTPILVLLIFPEILQPGLDLYWYILYWGISPILIGVTIIGFLFGYKNIKKDQSTLEILSKKMRILIYPGALLAILLGSCASGYFIYLKVDLAINSYNPSGIYLSSPKLGAPVFQSPASTFTAEFGEEEISSATLIAAKLMRGSEEIPLTVEIISSSQANFTIPLNCEPGLYSLNISVGSVVLYEPFAVRVWSAEDADPIRPFRVAQITDLHISPGENDEYSDFLQTTIDAIVISNPDLVLLTGDLTDDGEIHQYEALRDMILQFGQFGISMFMVLGNHDTYGRQYNNLEYWARNFAPYHFYRDIPGQNLRYIMFNTGARDSLFNLENEMPFIEESLISMDPTQESVLVCHIPPYRFCEWASNETQENLFYEFCEEYDVHAVFAGHSHQDRVVARRSVDAVEYIGECSDNYPELTAPFAETVYIETIGRDRNPSFRWINFKNGLIVNCTYDANGDGILDQKSSLSLKQIELGKGLMEKITESEWKTTINNSIKLNLWDAQAKLLLPATVDISSPTILIKEYGTNVDINNDGNILRSYGGNVEATWIDGDNKIVIVSFEIAAEKLVQISFTL